MSTKCYIVTENDIKSQDTELAFLPEINGQLNDSVMSGLVYQPAYRQVSFRKTEIGPNGYLAPHRANGVVCIQVISGSGATGTVDDEGNVGSEVRLKAGDFVAFEENMPLHYYKAEGEGLTYVAISMPWEV